MKDDNGDQAPCQGKFSFSSVDPDTNAPWANPVERVHALEQDGTQKDITVKFCISADQTVWDCREKPCRYRPGIRCSDRRGV